MPIHDYRCRDCGDEFELILRSTDVPACPACAGRSLERKLSTFAVSSAERSQGNFAQARKKYQQSKNRQEQLGHQAEEIREHMRDDYGIDIPAKTPTKRR